MTVRQIIVISGLWGLVAKMSISAGHINECIYHAEIAQIITPAAAPLTFWSRFLFLISGLRIRADFGVKSVRSVRV